MESKGCHGSSKVAFHGVARQRYTAVLKRGPPRGFVMDKVSIDLKHCYGIKALKRDLDFTKTRAYAIYAPNGVMKSSLAQTFADAAKGDDSHDRIFPGRPDDVP